MTVSNTLSGVVLPMWRELGTFREKSLQIGHESIRGEEQQEQREDLSTTVS